MDFDTALGGGLALGRLHEIYGASREDGAAAAGFAAALAIGASQDGGPVLWLRCRQALRGCGMVQGAGWAELGGAPERCLLLIAEDALALLRAAVDALRSDALAALVIEGWGTMRALDLTASRRLILAAERTQTLVLLLRGDAVPVPSAAETRWSVAAAPSAALAANAPGMPTFDLTLLRRRAGPAGLGWRLEWNRDRRLFQPALPGTVPAVPADRPAAADGAVRRIA